MFFWLAKWHHIFMLGGRNSYLLDLELGLTIIVHSLEIDLPCGHLNTQLRPFRKFRQPVGMSLFQCVKML